MKRSKLDGLGQMRVPEVVFPELHAILNLDRRVGRRRDAKEEIEERDEMQRRRKKKKKNSKYSRIPGSPYGAIASAW